ncbi:N-acetylglucosamine-6-phosphate deacetylase [Oxynema aestuarii]|uniref:N-acetylglucosamine-6-phosphate deacetylase n=1 Tax=Oxynema aestuarii AP17 TaxID=2064643 RepID=A0A6H1U180_9CYAN|nr:N-acetylglucosamine-6-phosphate deacetylase [Oxynema aestuarii AP17]
MSTPTPPLNSSTVSQCVNLDLINAQLPGYNGLHWVRTDREGYIESIQPMRSEKPPAPCLEQWQEMSLLDVNGDWVSLGGVDLQINGALGLAFPEVTDADGDRLQQICDRLWEQGVDGFLPTIVTTSTDKIQRALAAIAAWASRQHPQQQTAQILGVHLEGPFLNPAKRGAHPEADLQPLTRDRVNRVLGEFADLVKIVTLAPELDPSGEVIAELRSRGIVVSLGHSLATAAQANDAFDRGASMVTHAFNAMPSLHHREPGLLGPAILRPDVRCGLIADGQHVCPIAIELLLRSANYGKGVFLVSDALAPLGLPDGVYPWDERQIEVKNGTARLPDGTLAGTTLPLLTGVENLVRWGLCDVGEAIALATVSPRKAIGLPTLTVGQPANLLRWSYREDTGNLSWERLQCDRLGSAKQNRHRNPQSSSSASDP